jgi:hypothetical protein
VISDELSRPFSVSDDLVHIFARNVAEVFGRGRRDRPLLNIFCVNVSLVCLAQNVARPVVARRRRPVVVVKSSVLVAVLIMRLGVLHCVHRDLRVGLFDDSSVLQHHLWLSPKIIFLHFCR